MPGTARRIRIFFRRSIIDCGARPAKLIWYRYCDDAGRRGACVMSGTFGFRLWHQKLGVVVGQRITATARPTGAEAQDGNADWNVIEKLLKIA